MGTSLYLNLRLMISSIGLELKQWNSNRNELGIACESTMQTSLRSKDQN
jgi:hypothetical protein